MKPPPRAKFTIGDQEYFLGPLSIWSLERCWDAIVAFQNPKMPPFERVRRTVEILVSGLASTNKDIEQDMPGCVESFMKSITWEESMESLPLALAELLRISGFDKPQGEVKAASNSTETGQGSSPN